MLKTDERFWREDAAKIERVLKDSFEGPVMRHQLRTASSMDNIL